MNKFSSSICVYSMAHQILNMEKNLLKALPDSIGDLKLLQTLNLKGMTLPVCFDSSLCLCTSKIMCVVSNS